MLREPHPDATDALVWIAGLGECAFRAVQPELSHHLMWAAVLIAIGQPSPKALQERRRAQAADSELSGPERRCLGFLAAVLDHLGLVEQEPEKQLSLFGDDST